MLALSLNVFFQWNAWTWLGNRKIILLVFHSSYQQQADEES